MFAAGIAENDGMMRLEMRNNAITCIGLLAIRCSGHVSSLVHCVRLCALSTLVCIVIGYLVAVSIDLVVFTTVSECRRINVLWCLYFITPIGLTYESHVISLIEQSAKHSRMQGLLYPHFWVCRICIQTHYFVCACPCSHGLKINETIYKVLIDVPNESDKYVLVHEQILMNLLYRTGLPFYLVAMTHFLDGFEASLSQSPLSSNRSATCTREMNDPDFMRAHC